tara:strand:+ start:3363 stop:3719 length:357 start_codon:yes stop_codon:yes gene_type:complete
MLTRHNIYTRDRLLELIEDPSVDVYRYNHYGNPTYLGPVIKCEKKYIVDIRNCEGLRYLVELEREPPLYSDQMESWGYPKGETEFTYTYKNVMSEKDVERVNEYLLSRRRDKGVAPYE